VTLWVPGFPLIPSAQSAYLLSGKVRVMAAELNRHQCELQGLMRTTVMEKGKFLT
jgi:hypothetical protein